MRINSLPSQGTVTSRLPVSTQNENPSPQEPKDSLDPKPPQQQPPSKFPYRLVGAGVGMAAGIGLASVFPNVALGAVGMGAAVGVAGAVVGGVAGLVVLGPLLGNGGHTSGLAGGFAGIALGAIGGGVLGAVGGAALGTVVPQAGLALGGAVAGAFLGGRLAPQS